MGEVFQERRKKMLARTVFRSLSSNGLFAPSRGFATNPNLNGAKEDDPIVIVGGGAAGLAMLNVLNETFPAKQLCLIEPSPEVHYQPIWTLIGGGVCSSNAIESFSKRPTEDYIPVNTMWYQERAQEINPDSNEIILESGKKVSYRMLVMAAGLRINWDAIQGLKVAMGNEGVCSNYSREFAFHTQRFVEEFNGGKALFTFPGTPVKCAGAPQKIMYLAQNAWEQRGLIDKTDITFTSAIGKPFGVEKYCKALEKIADSKGCKREFGLDLVEIRGETKEAVFKVNKTLRPDDSDDIKVMNYDFIHVTPPMGPPNFIRNSPLADASGFVSVDKGNLQHTKYPNVFGIGDCSNSPTSKTPTAITAQVDVLGDTIVRVHKGQAPQKVYDGYTACPIPVGDDKLLMAEFDYTLQPSESWIFSQDSPSRFLYAVKKQMLPRVYFDFMLKGQWRGPQHYLLTRIIRYLRGSPN